MNSRSKMHRTNTIAAVASGFAALASATCAAILLWYTSGQYAEQQKQTEFMSKQYQEFAKQTELFHKQVEQQASQTAYLRSQAAPLLYAETFRVFDLPSKVTVRVRGISNHGNSDAGSCVAHLCFTAPGGRTVTFDQNVGSIPAKSQSGEVLFFLPHTIQSDNEKFSTLEYLKKNGLKLWVECYSPATDEKYSGTFEAKDFQVNKYMMDIDLYPP